MLFYSVPTEKQYVIFCTLLEYCADPINAYELGMHIKYMQ